MDGRCRLNAAAQPAKAPAGADEIAEGVESPACLPQDLGTRVQQVRPHVSRQPELIGTKRASRLHDPLCLLLDQRQVLARDLPRHRARHLVHQDHLGTEGAHHPGALHRVARRHHRHEGIPLDPADDGQAGPGVAAGELDHRLPGPESPVCLGILDDLPRDPVFLRKAGIEIFQLGENPAVQRPAEPPKFHQRRLPDRFDDGAQNVVVSVHGWPPLSAPRSECEFPHGTERPQPPGARPPRSRVRHSVPGSISRAGTPSEVLAVDGVP